LLAEAVGYLGTALALVAAILAAHQFWADFQTWAQLAFIGSVTVLLGMAGLAVPIRRDRALTRLASLLWFASTAGIATFLAILGNTALGFDDPDTGLLAAGGTALYAAALWIWRSYPLQQVTLFAAVAATALTGLGQFDGVPAEFFGLRCGRSGWAGCYSAWAGYCARRGRHSSSPPLCCTAR
jgi:hypothetical protein